MTALMLIFHDRHDRAQWLTAKPLSFWERWNYRLERSTATFAAVSLTRRM